MAGQGDCFNIVRIQDSVTQGLMTRIWTFEQWQVLKEKKPSFLCYIRYSEVQNHSSKAWTDFSYLDWISEPENSSAVFPTLCVRQLSS